MIAKKMLVLSALVAATVCLAALASCSPQSGSQGWQPPQPVRIEVTVKPEVPVEGKAKPEGESKAEGGSKWVNLFPSYLTWESAVPAGKSGGMLLRDGDVLIGGVWTVYRASDGAALKFTVEEWRTQLGGKTVSVALAKHTGGWEWLEKASPQDLAALRFVIMADELDADRLPLVKKLAEANPGVALQVQKVEVLTQVLPLFKPRVLILGDIEMTPESRKLFADQKRIETLLISAREKGSLDFLTDLPALRRLVIGNWDVEKAGPLPKGLTSLRSLMIFGWKAKDISALADAPAGLEELSLLACETLVDIKGVEKIAGLKTLILNMDKELADVSPIAGLKSLRWLGLPQKITKEQFAAAVKEHPDLAVLELVACEGAEDLSPLAGLKSLQSLVLIGPYKNLDVLRGLKSLRFVALADAAAKDSTAGVEALQKVLPDAMVVPAAPMCLGSGWLLAIFPAAAIAWLLAARPWRRMRARPQHG
ncbi:MAG: hypothetical protein NTY65_15850 [Planctomycetota bacterium]|nr:hypothetical protein [Planctomycetota bacterium]